MKGSIRTTLSAKLRRNALCPKKWLQRYVVDSLSSALRRFASFSLVFGSYRT